MTLNRELKLEAIWRAMEEVVGVPEESVSVVEKDDVYRAEWVAADSIDFERLVDGFDEGYIYPTESGRIQLRLKEIRQKELVFEAETFI